MIKDDRINFLRATLITARSYTTDQNLIKLFTETLIEDLQMAKPPYLFCLDLEPANQYANFVFVHKDYFSKHKQLDDCLTEIEDLPEGFANSMEAVWEYYPPGETNHYGKPRPGESGAITAHLKEGKEALENAGFTYSEELSELVNSHLEL